MFYRRALCVRAYSEWLLEPNTKPILVSASHQSDSCRRAHRRTCVGLKKSHASCGERVKMRSANVRMAITAEIGVGKIVRHGEENVWRWRRLPSEDYNGIPNHRRSSSRLQQSTSRFPRRDRCCVLNDIAIRGSLQLSLACTASYLTALSCNSYLSTVELRSR
jgi:hypothetical protein